MLERAGQLLVELFLFATDPFDQLRSKLARSFVGGKRREEEREILIAGSPADIYLIQGFECELASLMPDSHINGSARPHILPVGTHTARSSARGSACNLELREQMTEFFLLGSQVIDITDVRRDFERHPRDFHAVALQAFDLVRIVGQKPHFTDSEVAQNLGADTVVAEVFLEA